MTSHAPDRAAALRSRLQLEQYGSFLLRAEHNRVNKKGEPTNIGMSYGHVSNPYPREYASFVADVERLSRAVAAGGGKLDPSPSEVFDPGSEKIIYYEQLWGRFILAAIAVYLLDLLVRRVRMFDRKFVPKRRKHA